MRQRHPFAILVLALSAALCACGGASSPPPAPPSPAERPPPPPHKFNLLLILTEDQGVQMGAYGTPGLSTPHMDALAARGARFERAYITMGTCTTTKASLLTGRHNHLIGVTGNVPEFIGTHEELVAADPPWFRDRNSPYHRYAIPDDVPTLAEVLWQAGYYLGLQNKFHQSPHWKFPYDDWYPHGSGTSQQQVGDFIGRARETERPWVLLHNIGTTHRPWPDSSRTRLEVDPDRIEVPAHLPDTPEVRTDYAEYLQSVILADRRVGQVLQTLEDSGEAERTVVVLLGDHGPAYHRGKYTTYQLGLHVPLLIAGPGVVPASVRAEPFSGVDLMPTLLDLVDVPVPAGQDGVSHKALLTGADDAAPRQYLLGNTLSDRSISDGRFQLIFMPDPDDTFLPDDVRLPDPWRNRVYNHIVDNADTPGFELAYRLLDLADATLPRFRRPRFELYDLAADPWQINDLAQDARFAGTLDDLRLALCEKMAALGDPDPRPDPCP